MLNFEVHLLRAFARVIAAPSTLDLALIAVIVIFFAHGTLGRPPVPLLRYLQVLQISRLVFVTRVFGSGTMRLVDGALASHAPLARRLEPSLLLA